MSQGGPLGFVLAGWMEVSAELCGLALHRNRVFIEHRMTPDPDMRGEHWETVWDFVEKKCVSWRLPEEQAELIEYVCTFHVCRER